MTLSKQEIIQRINAGELILNPQRNSENIPMVEHASYDLRAGIAIWKPEGKKVSRKSLVQFDPDLGECGQPFVTIQPGQMMFIISFEEIRLPKNICGIVFSRNNLSRAGILALNTGHIDPGYQGHIVIRLINLRAVPYTLTLGTPIYSIVFNKLSYEDETALSCHEARSLKQTINIVKEQADTALSNALYDLALLNNFVKKGEFGKAYWAWLKTSVWGIVTIFFAIFGAIAAIIKIWEAIRPD